MAGSRITVLQVENPWLDLPERPPYVLSQDRPQVEAFNGRLRPADAEYRLDLRLIPAPFMGNPDAELVLLACNPGISPGDLEAHADPDFAGTLRANIQGHPESRAAVGLLDRFRSTPAGKYWRKTFKAVLQYVESADELATRVLIVEFYAYRSLSYRRMRKALPSQRFGFDLVGAAVRRGATIVILRGANDWHMAVQELRSYPNVVRLRNHRNSALSPGNCGQEGFRRILAAVGGDASAPSASPAPRNRRDPAEAQTRSALQPMSIGDDRRRQVSANTEAGSMTAKTALRRGGSRGERYVEFWTKLLERVQVEHPDWPSDRPHPKNDVDMRSPVPGTLISCGFAKNDRLRHELYIGSRDARRNMEIFDYLRHRQEQLEAAYGGPLQWEDLANKSACRIADYKHGCTIEERERFEEYVEWFIDAGKRLRAALIDVWSRP